MTQPSETQKLKQIRESRQAQALPWSHLSSPAQQFKMAGETLDFLLSLIDTRAPVDSQGAGDDTRSLLRKLKDFLFDNCDHADRDRNYDWCPKCVMAFVEVLARPSDTNGVWRR